MLAGSSYGLTSPVTTLSPLFFVDVALAANSSLELTSEHEERAMYVIEGALSCGEDRAEPGRLIVFAPGAKVTLSAERTSRFALLGGAPLEGERYMDWNFVSSSRERLIEAKANWRAGRFPKVPGDEVEFIPLP